MKITQTPTKSKLMATMLIVSMSLAGMEGIAIARANPDNALITILMLGILAFIGIIAHCFYYLRAKKEDEINGNPDIP